MKPNIKLIAVDIDGTFVHSDYTYDVKRFKKILTKIKNCGCHFVVASGNQYYQLRDIFPDDHQDLSFVAENGAFVKDKSELIYTADMPKETVDLIIDTCHEYPETKMVICGLESAYCERGAVDQDFFDMMSIYYHHLKWCDDPKQTNDQILKFCIVVPAEKNDFYCRIFQERFRGKAEPTSSGHEAIDIILPGCHKASGLKRLAERFRISPEQCVAFGDGGNDIEMLKYCGQSYAMNNASQSVKNAAKYVCPSNEEDGVLVTLDQLFA